MSLTNKFGLVAGTTALAIAGSAFGGVESDNDALSQIAELKQELAELKQQNGQDWLTEQRSSEIRGIVQDVLADADTRTSLQSSGAMAGYNNGFFLASPDGNFSLKVGGQIQIRWVMNSAKDQNTLYGFENRRTKLDFQGNVFSKDWTYRVRNNFSAEAGVSDLEFAYVQKAMDNGMSIRVGQFQAPWLREVLVDASMQLAAERSIVAQLFSQGYSQGIQWGMESDSFRINAGFFDGIGGANNFDTAGYNSRNTTWSASPTNYAFAARADFKLSGDWSQFDDFSSFKGEEAGMMAGVAVVYQRSNGNAAAAAAATAGNKVFGITGDFTWDFGGASLFASGVWVQNKPSGAGDTTSPWGVTLQGGYFVSEDAELFARYEYLNYNVKNNVNAQNVDKYNGVTFGVNYFFASGVKFTTDFSWNLKSLSGTNNAAALNGAGFRPDVGDNDNQWALRAQLQLLF
ncbi:MAG: hypothetical protein GY741_14535 [Phycisphaeraceae bacterium]|nr:hypothetical protein [Phycisphaeraceae bacterium]